MIKKQAGFTLVEIAIVLVIIGLLLGGVLKGREIINNAKVINIENSFTGISSAIYSYQDRYRALPGDDHDDKTENRWGVDGGNNDGDIGGEFNSKSSGESQYFWLHLRNAKLVAGAASDKIQPTNSFGGLMGASSTVDSAKIKISGVHVGFDKVPGKIVAIVETRSDDSNPKTGGIQATDSDGNAASSYEENKDYTVYFEL
ncbi:prepilin-type N-terminal cleavage/methylation domain-containing protein [Candidatus Albibeggiatoa sp. nov. NOAA]|uniref:prepilin-type N-terminal cleavage/methylation domain-containing protein n=1 Tax=Candidatus Albibeggiatoa sp. nov. NOAA TaxID=3162724 RepID=UPI0032FA87AA|nr:prepilin-type N-terminal cleavage/methylation domain-containing protein [Thiotrichaceae bacterium]